MKKLLTALLFVSIVSVLVASPVMADNIIKVERKNAPSFLGYAPDRLVVVLKPEAGVIKPKLSPQAVAVIGNADFDKISTKFAVSGIKKQFATAKTGTLSRYYKVKLEAGTLDEAYEAYSKNPLVERVEKVGMHAMYATPNDTYYDPYQWYHNATGDHDIDSPEAWDIQTGADATIVALLDSGTRYYHPDLGGANASVTNPQNSRGNMWINTAELNGSSGVDDDGNGYVDDWIGYDFIDGVSNCWTGEDCNTKDNDPRDFNGHGTHTAGIIAMLTNDGYGMAGVAGGWGNGSQSEYGNGVKVMTLRMGYSYNYLGQEYGVVMMDAAAEAFYYAADNGAKIASCSWGSSNSGGIGAAVDYFIAHGGIVCVAAGNDGAETSADYLNGRGDCISVAATDENDNGASFTTYGTWVDICAPGNNIYSTYHDHTDPNTIYWASMGGTSMATPMVAGVVGLIWSQNPSWTAAQVKTQLYSSADNIDAYLSSKYIGKMGAGRINAYNAVNTGPPPAPVANFSGSPTSGTAPLTVGFTDLSTGSITGWNWNFGDGGSSTSQNPSHQYTSAGTYSVSLTVTGPGGSDIETKTNYITVNPCVAPTAGFIGSPTSGDYPLLVSFTDQSSGATSYSWNFGDGGTSTSANPTHTYTAAGTFTVTQTVTNSCGSDQMVRTNYITVTTPPCDPPVADFIGSPTSGTAPLVVNFSDLSTDATSWSWDFGDGVGTSTAQNPSYTYNSAGTYTVQVTVSNACGSDVATKVDYISVTEPQVGMVFANSDISVLGTFSGTFANTSGSDNSYEVITESESTNHPVKVTSNAEHKWTFNLGSGGSDMMFYLEAYRPDNTDGDNFNFAYSIDDITYVNMITVASTTEQVYSYTMPAGLTGTVYVRVIDSNRSWGNVSLDDVFVDEMYFTFSTTPQPPVANFAGAPTSGAVPLSVSFTDLSTGSPDTWSWDFGDGSGTSALQNPNYTYNSIGTYTVSLTVTNAQGSDTETKVDYIAVSDVGNSMHVENMVVGRAKSGPNYLGTCTVTIFDDQSNPVNGATVYVTATGPTGGNYNGTTGIDGTVYFVTSGIKKPSGEWCFEVTNVTHASLTYDAGSNVVTQACESGPVFKGFNGISQVIPTEFDLAQNIPNPFNPVTEISFSLPSASYVSLDIYNMLGQKVVSLVDRVYEAGLHTVTWDASKQASGIYFYRLTAGEFTAQKKMLLLK